MEKIKIDNSETENKGLTKFTNQLVNKITKNLEKFHYNVIVANLHEMYNYLIKEIEKPINKKNLIENYRKILILMNPFVPHFSNECLNTIGKNGADWPIISEGQLIEEVINFVVQINGKKRALLKVNRDTDERNILKEIQINEDTKSLLLNKKIQKTIFVSNRLINIIL